MQQQKKMPWEAEPQEGTKLMSRSTNTLVLAVQVMPAVQQLPIGKEHFEPDLALPGHGIRCRRLKAGLSLRWGTPPKRLANGQQRRGDFGNALTVPVEAARKAARQFYATIALGQDPSAPRQQAKAEAEAQKSKLGLMVDRYLKVKKAELRSTSYDSVTYHLEKLAKELHCKPLNAVKRADVALWIEDLVGTYGKSTAAHARSSLHAFYNWAAYAGLCETNPVSRTINPVKGQKPRERVLSDPEIKMLWGHLPDSSFGRALKLLILTGARRDEIGDLQWHEIDFETGTMTIRGSRTKNGSDLILTLPPMALAILKSAPGRKDQPFVFGTKPGAGFSAWSSAKLLVDNRIAATIGKPLPPWTIHDLRRTMRTGLGRVGVAPHIAELAINHLKKDIEAIYDKHKYAAEITAALQLWADHIAAVVEGRRAQVTPLRAA
jgi:integrase